METISYKEIRNNYFKPQDSWSERFMVHIFSGPIAYSILKISRSDRLPYVITILIFPINLFGAYLIYEGFYRIGAILLFFAFIMDNVDGVISRFIFTKDPELRGTLDYTLDNFALFPILIALFLTFLKRGEFLEEILFFVLIGLLIVFFSLLSTRFRLMQEIARRESSSVFDKQIRDYIDENSFIFLGLLLKIYTKVKNLAYKLKVYPLPSIPDVHMLVYIVLPFIGFRYSIAILISAVCILILNIFEIIFVNYALVNGCSRKFIETNDRRN